MNTRGGRLASLWASCLWILWLRSLLRCAICSLRWAWLAYGVAETKLADALARDDDDEDDDGCGGELLPALADRFAVAAPPPPSASPSRSTGAWAESFLGADLLLLLLVPAARPAAAFSHVVL
jgi:hypothetical protein